MSWVLCVVVGIFVDVCSCARPRKIPVDDANRPELLVPVRLELDIEHHKMRDTFIWNLNGSHFILRHSCCVILIVCF